MQIILLLTTISILSISSSHASDKFLCDKASDLLNMPAQALNPQAKISGSEKYQSNKDTYNHVIVKTTEGQISSSDYKKYLARCQTGTSDTNSH